MRLSFPQRRVVVHLGTYGVASRFWFDPQSIEALELRRGAIEPVIAPGGEKSRVLIRLTPVGEVAAASYMRKAV